MTDTYLGPERRMADPWRARAEQRMSDLDDGQRHIIKQIEDVNKRLDSQDEMLARGASVMKQLLDETVEVRKAVSGARWTGRVIAACGRAVHMVVRHLAPILAFALLVWGAIYAFFNGGKPPSVG